MTRSTQSQIDTAATPTPSYLRILVLGATALIAWAGFATAWVAEDAFITFRSVEQLFAGNGPRWNPHERVQAFTHPLWFGLLAVGRLLTSDLYAVAIALGLACTGAALWLLARGARQARTLAFTLLLLAGSRAFTEYATSGLETSLSFLFVAGFVGTILAEPARRGSARLLGLSTLVGLALINRQDLATLLAPAWLLEAGLHIAAQRRSRGTLAALARTGLILAAGLLPFAAWNAFSLVYYGFPFPNTAYAKLSTGLGTLAVLPQGLRYLLDFPRTDPAGTLMLGAGLVTLIQSARARRDARAAALALGIVLNLAYVVRVGGDFMSGRFFAPGLFLAACAFTRLRTTAPSRALVRTGAFAVLILFAFARAPLLNGPWSRHAQRMWHGIADERRYFLDATSIWVWLRTPAGAPFPDHHPFVERARRYWPEGRAGAPILDGNIGIIGYLAPLDQVVVDPNALSDPLLARLPAAPGWRIGHFTREVPAGYLESIASGENRLVEPAVRETYEALRTVTQGDDLWAAERWRAIARINLPDLFRSR